jgi:hypothetical protein
MQSESKAEVAFYALCWIMEGKHLTLKRFLVYRVVPSCVMHKRLEAVT